MSTRTGLTPPKTAEELLEMYFLDIRCHLLEAASGLDRIERAEGGAKALANPKAQQLLAALDILKVTGGDRAPRFLNHLSE